MFKFLWKRDENKKVEKETPVAARPEPSRPSVSLPPGPSAAEAAKVTQSKRKSPTACTGTPGTPALASPSTATLRSPQKKGTPRSLPAKSPISPKTVSPEARCIKACADNAEEKGQAKKAKTPRSPKRKTNCEGTPTLKTIPTPQKTSPKTPRVTSEESIDQIFVMSDEESTDPLSVLPGVIASNRASKWAVDEFVKSITRAGLAGLQREFDELDEFKTHYFSSDAFTANMTLNRYEANICLDSSRVVLSLDVPPCTDYIHANWVRVANSVTTFIAAQGPMENTVMDFWRMCCQEKVTSILMLCNVTDTAKKKCVQYWPDKEAQSATYGSISIQNKKMIEKDSYEVASLEVVSTIDGKLQPLQCIELVHMICWPDGGVPAGKKTRDLLVFLLQRIRRRRRGPCVVHCMAGAGRTGAAITISVAIDRLFRGVHVKLDELVKELRTTRAHVVMTKAQYIFVALTVLEYIESKAKGVYDKEIRLFRRDVKEICR